MRSIPIVIFVALARASSASDDGGVQGPFGFTTGAAALGRGGVVAVGGETAWALTTNPASLGLAERIEAGGSYVTLPAGSASMSLSGAGPLLESAGLGLSIARVSAADSPGLDALGSETGSRISTASTQGSLGAGALVANGLLAGLAINVGALSVAGRSSTGVSIDLGVLADLGPASAATGTGIRAGAVVRGIVPMRWQTGGGGESIARSVEAGLSAGARVSERLADRLSIALDVQQSLSPGAFGASQPRPRLRAGAEYGRPDLALARAGYDGEGPTVGLGIRAAGGSLDYAAAFHELGISHRMSLSARFGASRAELRDRRKAADRAKIEAEVKAQVAAELSKERGAKAAEFVKRGNELLAAGKADEAAAQFETARAWAPGSAEADAGIARAKASAETFRKAEAVRRKADRIAAGDAAAKAGRDFEAIAEWRIALELDPADAALSDKIESARGRVKAGQESAHGTPGPGATPAAGATDAAIRTLRRTALDAYVEGNYEAAADAWRKITDLDPADAAAREGSKRAENAAADQAKRRKEKVAEADRVKNQRLYLDGVIAYTRGDLRGAAEKWRKVLETDPENYEAKRDLARAELKLKFIEGR